MTHFINKDHIYTIHLKLNHYKDIYCNSPYCAAETEELSPEFRLFLHNNVQKAPQNSKLELRFYVPLSSKDINLEVNVSNLIRNHYLTGINNLINVLNESYRHILKYIVIASMLIFIGFVLQLNHERTLFIFTILESVNIAAWVFLWEAIYTFCFRNKKVSSELKEYKRIYSSNIVFEYKSKNI